MSDLRLDALYVYPVKSAAGIPLREAEVDQFGLRHDRRWMVVDARSRMLTQRTHPRLALVLPTLEGGVLRLGAPGMPRLDLPLEPAEGPRGTVVVWDDRCEGTAAGAEAAAWVSEFLGAPCSLVYMPASTFRPADPDYAPSGTRVSFADAFPFLLLTDASLADLNRRLPRPVPMDRFRPNLVVAGAEPYAEDQWTTFRIGAIGFQAVKPCARCSVPAVDQLTARRGKEPIRTLATYRTRGGQVYFGQNVVHDGPGRLQTGDPMTIPTA